MTNTAKLNWTHFLIGGLVALVYGLLALLLPGGIIQTIMTVSGIILIIAGVICFLISLNRKKKMQAWKMLLFESIVMVLLGLAAVIWSQKTVEVLIIIIGIWVAFIGLMQLIFLLKISKFVYKGFFIVCSLLALVFGILMIINPFESAEFFVTLTGVIALLVGIMTTMFSLAVKRVEG